MLKQTAMNSAVRTMRQVIQVDVAPTSREGHVAANTIPTNNSTGGFVDSGKHYFTIGFDGINDGDTWSLG